LPRFEAIPDSEFVLIGLNFKGLMPLMYNIFFDFYMILEIFLEKHKKTG